MGRVLTLRFRVTGVSYEKEQVQTFYDVIWNQHDKSKIPEVLHAAFRFRGSLGLKKQGHSGFAGYLDMVHAALGDYRCVVGEVVSEPCRAFAKMQFSGVHRGCFLGYPPTGRRVTWEGAALFHFSGEKISELWVLGDLKSLEAQLAGGQS